MKIHGSTAAKQCQPDCYSQKELEDSYAKLQQGEKEYAEGKQQLEDGWAQYYAAESELKVPGRRSPAVGRKVNEGKQQLEESKQQLEDSSSRLLYWKPRYLLSATAILCKAELRRWANGDNPFSIAIYKGMLSGRNRAWHPTSPSWQTLSLKISQAEQQIAASEQELRDLDASWKRQRLKFLQLKQNWKTADSSWRKANQH